MRRFATAASVATLCATHVCAAQTHMRSGLAYGQLKFSDGAKVTALGATVAARMWNWLDVSVNPTYAWAHSEAYAASPTVTVAARDVRGFTDLPVALGVSYGLPGQWSPSIGFAVGITLPLGDPNTLGSGQTGVGASMNLGFEPAEDRWVSVGGGRSLSNGYSASLASSSPTSLAISAGLESLGVHFSASLSGDVGAPSSGYEGARSFAAGMSWPIDGGMSFSLDGSRGLSGGAPQWAYSIGLGTTPTGLAAATVAPYQRLRQSFGAGTGTKNKPKTAKP
jgi:hypothetical protein